MLTYIILDACALDSFYTAIYWDNPHIIFRHPNPPPLIQEEHWSVSVERKVQEVLGKLA